MAIVTVGVYIGFEETIKGWVSVAYGVALFVYVLGVTIVLAAIIDLAGGLIAIKPMP